MSAILRKAAPAVLGFAILVLAHGEEEATSMAGMDMAMPAAAPSVDDSASNVTISDVPNSYWNHSEHSGALFAHIITMSLAWFIVLPIAVMFSLAKSRYTIFSQLVFGALNSLGVVIAIGYNASTPDLYPNNAHHKLGWIVTFAIGAQVFIGLVGQFAGTFGKKPSVDEQYERVAFMPPAEDHSGRFHHPNMHRNSDESSTHASASSSHSRSSSASTVADNSHFELQNIQKEQYHEPETVPASPVFMPSKDSRWGRISDKIAGAFSARWWRIFAVYYQVIDRVSLILGFICICTGIVTLGRFFEGSHIFSGLAHWIKGGIFLWLGILTLGRWSGSFGDLGWAWNIRPKSKNQSWRPTAEFTESFFIFLYGITNVFLEHLGSKDGTWSHQDLEHLSITILFIGGGACGMLIESDMMRQLLNTTVDETQENPINFATDEERGEIQEPVQYRFSMNPIPALVILLLGIMMSSHQQHTAISTMIHKQWGDLLSGASFCRALTYIIMWLRPPTSIYPSRPPTELLTSFGLIAGGIIFMASASNTVDAIIRAELDAMFLYTVTMGFVGLFMAWILMVLALKGWAVRKEKARRG